MIEQMRDVDSVTSDRPARSGCLCRLNPHLPNIISYSDQPKPCLELNGKKVWLSTIAWKWSEYHVEAVKDIKIYMWYYYYIYQL